VLRTLGERRSAALKTPLLQRLTARDGLWNAPLWARTGLVTLALGVFALRFGDRDLVSYVLDEPQLQDAAQTDAQAGRWASISVLHGTQGKRYGPTALWFYTAVHHLAGPLPERSILATTLLLTLSQLGLALAAAAALGGGAILFSTLAVLLASSPYLFFWARTAWDNPLLGALVALAVAVLLARRLPAPLRGGLLGLLLGLGLSTHLMAIPFTLAVVGVLLLEGRRHRASLGAVAALLVVALLVNLPYLQALAKEPPSPSPAWQRWGGPAAAVGRVGFQLLEPARVLTAAGVDGFFDGAATAVHQGLGPWRLPIEVGPSLSAFLALLASVGLLAAMRSASPKARQLGLLGVLVWLGHALFLGLPALQPEPHYQQPTTWLVATGCCALVMALLPSRPKAAWLLLGGLWAVALADAGFIEAWMGWVRQHGGTAGTHYSVPLSAQRQFLRDACSTERPRVALANRTLLFPQSLLSLAQTEAACTGKTVGVCPGSCPSLDAQWRLVSLRYSAPPGGRLAPVSRP
jgi:hypothetical protein